MQLHPDINVQRMTVGAEKAPLLVIDNFVADADELVDRAAAKQFTASTRYFPGIRARAPLSYQDLIASRLKDLLCEYFQIEGRTVRFTMCHYSIVTTEPAKLAPIQRIPHVDSLPREGLASIHYLFRKHWGGTAFYRHRATGFEFIDDARKERYFTTLAAEQEGPDAPAPQYINGDTALFEQIAMRDGVFNRMLIYRRNSLHSSCIASDFVPDPSPRTGRLSINSFIDLA